MYPFHWVPAGGVRHASTDARSAGLLVYPTGTPVSTLCGLDAVADNSELAWLWATCAECNSQAHRIAQSFTGSITGKEPGKWALRP